MSAINSFMDLLAAYKKGGETKRKDWLNKATSKMKKKGTVGAFTDYCGGKVTADCIERGLRSKDPKIRRRAAFAKAVRSFNKAYGGETGDYMGYYDIDNFVKNSKYDFLKNISGNVLNRMAEDLDNLAEAKSNYEEQVKKFGGILKRLYQEGGDVPDANAGMEGYMPGPGAEMEGARYAPEQAGGQPEDQVRLQVIDTMTYEEYVLATHKHPDYLQRLLSELESVQNNQGMMSANTNG